MAKFLSPREAAEYIRNGKLVSFPTETVYGIGADALNPDAVKRIFEVKKRNIKNPLICHLPDPEAVFKYGRKSELAEKLSRYWPGPLTLLLPHEGKIPEIVTAGSPYCAFRIPDHPLALSILKMVDRPVAAPSANLSGMRSPVSAEMVAEQLGESIDGIVDGGRCEIGIESTVLLLHDSGIEILRHGSITEEFLSQEGFRIIKKESQEKSEEAPLQSPGLEKVHYRPSVPLILVENQAGSNFTPVPARTLPLTHIPFSNVGLITFAGALPELPRLNRSKVFDLSPGGDLKEAARNLYHVFHLLKTSGIDAVYALSLPDRAEGRALNDRLKRSSTYTAFLSDKKEFRYFET